MAVVEGGADMAAMDHCAAVGHGGGEMKAETAAAGAAAAAAAAQPAAPQTPTEEDRLWSIVTANSADFTSWTLLIQEAERLDVIEKIRRVYDTFLAEFPLCYGYWKKYADHEGRHGHQEKIAEVYERAVKGVTYSVDIWMHYCTYVAEKSEDMGEIRRLFERGLDYVGTDYLAHLLWDKYLEFEYSQEEWGRVAQLYTRILHIPMQQIDRYYQSFKQYVHKQVQSGRPLEELLSPEDVAEFAALEETEGNGQDVEGAAAAAAGSEADGDASAKAAEEKTTSKPRVLSEQEKLEKYLARRDEMYRLTKEQDAKIHDYEIAIRRPYFHVKPLDEMQLANWHRYLDFLEKEGNLRKVSKLYERCLIACANYSEYWIRYVDHLEGAAQLEQAEDALVRAATIFVKRRSEVHLYAARYYEKHENATGARKHYELLCTELAVGLLEAVLKFANLERRQGNLDKAKAVFEAALETEKAKEDPKAFVHLTMQYARFLDQVTRNTEKAREVFREGVERVPSSKALWQGFIFFETLHLQDGGGLSRVQALVEQAITPSPRADGSGLSVGDREEISLQFLELIDLHGDSVAVRKAEAVHKKFFPATRKGDSSKKRSLENSGTSERGSKAHKSAANMAMMTAPSAVSMGAGQIAYANGQQGQWGAAGYGGVAQSFGQQQQGWQQQAPQQTAVVGHGQQQQWGGGYGAQGQQTYPVQQQAYGGQGAGQAYRPAAAQPAPQQQQQQQGYYQGYHQ